MLRLGFVVADAPGDCVGAYLEAETQAMRVIRAYSPVPHKPFVCAVNRAGLKLAAYTCLFDVWSSWHYAMLLKWADHVGFHGELVTDNNTPDPRITVCPVPYAGGSSTFPAAQILHHHYHCRRVIVVNTLFNGNYRHFLQPWREKAPHLTWCRAYTGPLSEILGIPDATWLIPDSLRPASTELPER